MSALLLMWQDARRQYAETPRLRMALWAVLAIFWIYGLILAGDALPQWRAGLETRRLEVERLQNMEPAAVWEERGRDAQQLLKGVQALSWAEARPGLAQAEVQDWLRALAGKTGLVVRELRLASAESSAAVGGKAPSPKAPDKVRVRLSVEVTPQALVVFLAELGQAERGAFVERLQLKSWTKPAVAELDIGVKLRPTEVGAP